jgi:hypothetical protein
MGQETKNDCAGEAKKKNYCSAVCVPPVVDEVPLNELIKRTRMSIFGWGRQESVYHLIISAVTWSDRWLAGWMNAGTYLIPKNCWICIRNYVSLCTKAQVYLNVRIWICYVIPGRHNILQISYNLSRSLIQTRRYTCFNAVILYVFKICSKASKAL